MSGAPATLTLPAPHTLDELAPKNIVITTTPAPILIGPKSGGIGPGPTDWGTSQTFIWYPVAGATSYLLEVQDLTAGARKRSTRSALRRC